MDSIEKLPKVSVLINSYNYGRFLNVAVESVLAQDYKGEIECIVVDDGSTDGTPKIMRPYLDRVHYIRQENAGQAAAVNSGYRNSTGEIIFFLDADDYWLDGKVSAVVARYAGQPNLGLVNHSHILVDEEGCYVDRSRHRVETPYVYSDAMDYCDGDLRERMIEEGLPWLFNTTSTMSLPRKICEAVFPLDETLPVNADTLFATAAALLAPVGYIREPLSYYRLHGDNHWSMSEDSDEVKDGSLRRRAILARMKQITVSVELMKKLGLPYRAILGSWPYIKTQAMATERPFVIFLPRAWTEIWRWEAPWRKKLYRVYEVTRKSVKRTWRGRWRL